MRPYVLMRPVASNASGKSGWGPPAALQCLLSRTAGGPQPDTSMHTMRRPPSGDRGGW